jgi:nucleoside-diphosphate-sugar epimerase
METKIDKEWVERTDLEYILSAAKNSFEILSKKNLLLTGAGGFLGYYFIKSILAWNDAYPKKVIHLTVLSTFTKGVPSWMKRLHKRIDLRLIKGDITKYKISGRENFDYIIHAASSASPPYYRKYPIETINANVQGLYRILEYMLKRKTSTRPARGLLNFSSSEIYGDPTKGNIPTPEDYRGNVSCTGPRACYDESKRFCETLSVNYARVHKLPIKSARPFNNYGPGMKITDGRVIADFSRNIVGNRDITMLSDGGPSRTFCYVSDAIVGYLKILTSGESGQAYNIGVEGPEIRVRELATRMIKIAKAHFNYKGKLVKKLSTDREYLTDNPIRRCPDIKKARSKLGFNPSVSLDEGLLKTLVWYHNS